MMGDRTCPTQSCQTLMCMEMDHPRRESRSMECDSLHRLRNTLVEPEVSAKNRSFACHNQIGFEGLPNAMRATVEMTVTIAVNRRTYATSFMRARQ